MFISETVNRRKYQIMNKTVWLVTHGETVLRKPDGTLQPDPEMSQEGRHSLDTVAIMLYQKLGESLPPEIHCGTGHRQYQVAQTIFLNPSNVFFSSLWGDASTLAMEDGKRMILLSHGLLISYEQYHSAKHVGGETIRKVLASLPDNSVICSGRPVLIRLGMKPEECHNGALYALRVKKNGEVKIELVQQGRILAS